MNKKGLLYLLDKELTPGKLRALKDIPDVDYSKIENLLQKNGIKFAVEGDNDYNYKLSFIKSKPYIIYYKGNIDILNKNLLGIVGPRECSTYGEKILEKLFAELKTKDICTITGMAPGIDTMTHKFSIQNHIPTIAVLGGGIMYYYSRAERYLMDSIIDNGGTILSEFRIDFEPTKYSFPQRNRIIAGLCDLLFLPEAGKKSGSLITADFAFDMKKKIYGTPNGIFDDISAGLNEYISKGKITAVNDIPAFVQQNFTKKKTAEMITDTYKIDLNPTEKEIIKFFEKEESICVDFLAQNISKDFSEIMTALSNLEINGLISEKSPGFYSKN